MDNNKKSLLGNEEGNLSFQVEILSTLDDIKISKQNDLLILENSFIRRVIDLSQGLPRTISLQNSQSIELAAKDNLAFDIGFIGLIDTENSNDQWQLKSITCVKKKHDIFETKRLIVEISCENISSQIICTKTYILYPNLGVIGVESSIQTKVMPNFFWSHRKRIPQIQCVESAGDSFKLASTIVPVLSVEFKGRTDEEAVPVLTHLVTEDTMIGNLLYCENNSQLGLMFLQEAPPSMEKRDYEEYDFRYDSKTNVIRSCTWGVAPEDIKVGSQIYKSYRHVLLVYQNEEEKKSIGLRFRGSSNQRIIDMKKTSEQGAIVIWDGCKLDRTFGDTASATK